MSSWNRLRAATSRLITAVNGQDAAVATIFEATGHKPARQGLSECLNKQPRSIPVNQAFILEDVANRNDPAWPQVTRTLASLHGFILVRVPDAPPGASDWLGGMGALARQAGDVTAKIADALADSVVNKREAAAIIAEIDEAQTALAALRVLAEAAQ